MKEVTLPSGAVLKVSPARFAESKALYQAMLKEVKSIEIVKGTQISEVVKEVLCMTYASPEIEKALWECMKHCQYGPTGLKIDGDTFEPVEARGDYMLVCMEVAEENLLPFSKSLSAVLQRLSDLVIKNLA